MQKKRLLITISLSNSIRYILRTGLLNQLRNFCEPVLIFTWNQEDVISELREAGFEVYVSEEGMWQPAYAGVRNKIDIWFDWFALKYNSKKIERKYLNQFVPVRKRMKRKLRDYYQVVKLLNPYYRRELFESERELVISATNYKYYEKLIDKIQPDAVFTLTPFHRQEDILLRVCKDAGLQMITSILSFDNITKRGWIPVLYDVYMLWNKYNKAELYSIYPETKSKQVVVTGAPQFDFYFDKGYLYKEDEWREITGLHDRKRKIILYAGGPKALFPNEPQYPKALDKAIQDGTIKHNPVIFFRCHPIDRIERWKEALVDCKNIVYDISWTGEEVLYNANVKDADIKKLCSTLAYCDVHINLCSTMTVDGSAYGKPQIAPYYDDVNKQKERLLQNLYLQQHFLPIMHCGVPALAHSKERLIELVNDSIENPRNSDMGLNVLQEIITYTDGHSTDRVIEVIKNALLNV